MAWSGDMVQAPDRQAVAAVRGRVGGRNALDRQLIIPKAAAHKGTAELIVNYYYDPTVSAAVSGSVDYISPVKGSDEILIKANPDDANNPLIIPPPDWVKRLHIFGPLSEADETYFNAQFAKVIGVG